jgi:hypothetical protein
MMANTENVAEQGPISGVNKALENFRRQLSSSRFHVLKDKAVLDLLSSYCWDEGSVESELRYLKGVRVDGLPYCQSIKQAKQLDEQLLRFGERNYPNFGWNRFYQESLEAMIREFGSWHLKPLHFHSCEDVRNALPKEDTHSGYLFLETGKKEKGDNVEEAFSYYGEAVSAVKQGLHVRQFPILPGCRTQGSGVYASDGSRTPRNAKLKTRLVSMKDMREIVLEMMFSKPFQDRYSSYQRYAGGKNDNEIHSLVFDKASRHTRWVSLDYSHYDQSISDWLIRDAFKVVASAFALNDFERRMLDEVVRIFIAKDFVVPHSLDGLYPSGLLHSRKGVPSGSMFTQIIDSIVNELMIRTVMRALDIRDYDMLIMGDDNLLFYKDSEPRGVDICSYLTHNFGIQANPAKLASGECSKAKFEFLSRTWTIQGAYRHPNILLSKLAYPERFRNYSDGASPALVLYSYCLAYPVGMRELMDVDKFYKDFRGTELLKSRMVEKGRYISGYLKYQYQYLGVEDFSAY